MWSSLRRAAAVAVGCAAASFAMPGASAGPISSSAASASRWRVVFQAPLTRPNTIVDLATASRTEAWAIGQFDTSSSDGYAVHWDGRRWRLVRLRTGFWPRSVFASAPGNIWIDGLQNSGSSDTVAALRWEGTGWQGMPLPPMYGANIALATGASDAWALGLRGGHDGAAFWDGGTWTPRPFPRLGPHPVLAASPGGGVWAFGARMIGSQVGRLMAFRWTGSGWRELRTPHPLVEYGAVEAAVGSPRSIWLETVSTKRHDGGFLAGLWHWNGTRLIPLPTPLAMGNGLAADEHGGAWFGPVAHWAADHWVYPGHPTRCRDAGLSQAVSHVPGTRSTWGDLDCMASRTGEIEVNGPLP